MDYIEINNLIPHPQNDYYFDDITGEKWEELLTSIQLNGVHTPILITAPDKDSNIPKHKKIIISGHQRVRACLELGIKKIPYTYKHYKSEDEMLLALIESNIIQRGIGNANPLKLGRCLNELDRIYGIKRGNNQHSNPNNLDSNILKRSKKDIANALELSQETLTNYQKLTHLDDALQEMLLNNKLSPTNGIKIAKKVSKEQQKEMVELIQKEDGRKQSKIINSFILCKTNNKNDAFLQKTYNIYDEVSGLIEFCGKYNIDREEFVKQAIQEKLEKDWFAKDNRHMKKWIFDVFVDYERKNGKVTCNSFELKRQILINKGVIKRIPNGYCLADNSDNIITFK